MHTRSEAARSVGDGGAGAGASPPEATTRRRSARAVSSAAPTSSAPRGGAFGVRAAPAGQEPAEGAVARGGPAGSATGVAEDGGASADTDAGTAIVFRPFSGRPGTCSSSTAWKFVPPKPNALTPATRVPPLAGVQSRGSVLPANGVADQSTFALGGAKPRLGGSVLWCSASVALSI